MNPQLVTGDTLRTVIFAQSGAFAELADASYYLVTPEWMDGDFASAYYDFLRLFDLLDWKPESNDCDKFAGWAIAVATALHSRTARKLNLPPGGLAMGRWFYKPDWSPDNHAINWFAHAVPVDELHPEGIGLSHFEPNGRTRRIVRLSDAELVSCFKCAN